MSNPNLSSSALPLYLQISETLIREIAAGRLMDGERLPPERELAKQYGTTVRTLRKSLAELEKQGMLERVQGSGNYVRATQSGRSVYSMFRLELPEGGGLPTADILSVHDMEKPTDLPTFGTSNHGARIRRLRYLDEVVIAVEEIWLDGDAQSGPRQTVGIAVPLLSKAARFLDSPRRRPRLHRARAGLGARGLRPNAGGNFWLHRTPELVASPLSGRVFAHVV